MKLAKIIITTLFLFIATLLYADITVLKIEGSAAYKDGHKWVPLKVNQKLPEGTKISTGANSFVDIKLNSKNHTIRVEPYSMIQIFSKETQTNTNTNIGLKRGSINAKVPRNENVKTEFKVTSPVATSSVRGTEENISYGPDTGMVVEVVSGEVEGKNNSGRTQLITGRQKFVQPDSSGKPNHILQDVRDSSVVQVSSLGLTPEEKESMMYIDELTGSPDSGKSVLNNQSHNKGINRWEGKQAPGALGGRPPISPWPPTQ